MRSAGGLAIALLICLTLYAPQGTVRDAMIFLLGFTLGGTAIVYSLRWIEITPEERDK